MQVAKKIQNQNKNRLINVTVVDCSHGHFHSWIATQRRFMPAEGDLSCLNAQKCIDIYEIPGFSASFAVY